MNETRSESEVKPNKTSRCYLCQEPIYPTAKMCNACHSYQDWRRFFSFSSVILSLLIALISVVSAVGPGIVGMLFPPRSHLVVASCDYTKDGIAVLVQNDGSRLGEIGRVKMVVYCKGLYFKRSDRPPELHDALDWQKYTFGKVQLLPLDISREGSMTIPPNSPKAVPFTISPDILSQIKDSYPENAPVGDYWTSLYNESIVLDVDIELKDLVGNRVETKHVIYSEPFWWLMSSRG